MAHPRNGSSCALGFWFGVLGASQFRTSRGFPNFSLVNVVNASPVSHARGGRAPRLRAACFVATSSQPCLVPGKSYKYNSFHLESRV